MLEFEPLWSLCRAKKSMANATGWNGLYQELIDDIPGIAATAPIMLFGLSACVDARIIAHELTPLFAATAPRKQRPSAQW